MSEQLVGKVAIVTGAGSGIGRASAIKFAENGAMVICADLSKKVNDTANEIIAAGFKAIAIEVDASDEKQVSDLVESAKNQFGGLHIFYANAGIIGKPMAGYFDASAEDWLEVLKVNLIGPFLAIKYAGPMIEQSGGGTIICTASVAGLRSGAGPAQYSASKAGVINLVQTAAQQLAGKNVRVNAICPGLIETGMTKIVFDYARDAGKTEKLGQLNPSLRAGIPEDIANVALFLASPQSDYINGQAIVVDGGLSSSHPTASRPGNLKRGAAW